MNAYIKNIGIYLPGKPISNTEFVKRYSNISLDATTLTSLFGSKWRHLAPPEMQVSDLAVSAARNILGVNDEKSIDLLIFASASSDLIEPATCNIVQSKLGLNCPSFDVKNACNSFLSALQIATSFIENGTYSNVLIVSGEKPSDSINFKAKSKQELKINMAAISFGDAGSAVWLSSSKQKKGISFLKFLTRGEHWNLSTIKGGGSLYPSETDKHYFEGNTSKLFEVLNDEELKAFASDCFKQTKIPKDEIKLLITHQISTHFYKNLSLSLDFPKQRIFQNFTKYGNTAATSIPIALHDAMKEGVVKENDKIILVGVAAGLSIGFVSLTL